MSRKIEDEELIEVNGGVDVVIGLEEGDAAPRLKPNRNSFCKCPPLATGDSTTIEHEPNPEGDVSSDLMD